MQQGEDILINVLIILKRFMAISVSGKVRVFLKSSKIKVAPNFNVLSVPPYCSGQFLWTVYHRYIFFMQMKGGDIICTQGCMPIGW
jgi:hypothetical protein